MPRHGFHYTVTPVLTPTWFVPSVAHGGASPATTQSTNATDPRRLRKRQAMLRYSGITFMSRVELADKTFRTGKLFHVTFLALVWIFNKRRRYGQVRAGKKTKKEKKKVIKMSSREYIKPYSTHTSTWRSSVPLSLCAPCLVVLPPVTRFWQFGGVNQSRTQSSYDWTPSKGEHTRPHGCLFWLCVSRISTGLLANKHLLLLFFFKNILFLGYVLRHCQ